MTEQDTDCICNNNWRKIIAEYQDQIGNTFYDKNDEPLTFFGIVWSNDDFYYGFCYQDDYQMVLCSCVGDVTDIETTIRYRR